MQLHGIGLGIARATPDGFEIVDADVQPLTGAFVPPGGGFQMWGRPFTIPGLTAADLVHAWPVLIADVEITSVSRPPWSAGPDAEQTERPPSRTRHVVHGPRSLLADLIAPRPWTR